MVCLNARRFVACALAVLVAGGLSFPSAALALESGTVDGNAIANGTAANGAGSGGGTWAYDGADTITLDNFVGTAIETVGDTVVDLQGDNTASGIKTTDGDLTVNGDSEAAGDAKPSLTVTVDAKDSLFGIEVSGNGDLAVNDAHIVVDNEFGVIDTDNGDVTITNSKVEGSADNKHLSIGAIGYDQATQTSTEANLTLKGSVVTASSVAAPTGTLAIDNTDLTVTKPDDWDDDHIGETPWIELAVYGRKVVLTGESNGVVVDRTFMGEAYQYVTTGSDDKVELKASEKPAYYNGGSSTKGMPATGDRAMSLVAGLGVAAMAVAALGAFSLRSRRAKDRHAR